MQTDHVRIMCPALSCRKILAVPVSSRGKNVRCKNCGATIRIPERSLPVPHPATAQADKDKDKKSDAKPAKPAQAA